MKRILALLFLAAFSLHAQTPVTLGPVPKAQFLSNTGAPLAGGRVFTYAAGTSVQQATFTDSTGTIQNSNPIILDAAGRANIWFQGLAYKIVVQTSAGVGVYTVDNFQVSPFLAGNNSFTGNNTFAGITTFNGNVTFSAGGSMSGIFSGSPTFNGSPTFSGAPIYTGTPVFNDGLNVDTINGTLTNGGVLNVNGAMGGANSAGEGITLAGGMGGPTAPAAGGNVSILGGTGGAAGGKGGDATIVSGTAASGNSNGGTVEVGGGAGSGTGHGGDFAFVGAPGGSSAGRGSQVLFTAGTGGAGGNGGDIVITPGLAGSGGKTGSFIFGIGRFIYTAPYFTPSCTSTGLGVGANSRCFTDSQSDDSDGYIILDTDSGATTSANGVITLTFNQAMGANGAECIATLNNGGAIWDPRATVIVGATATATAIFYWDNNSVTFTAGDNYNIGYHCVGRQ